MIVELKLKIKLKYLGDDEILRAVRAWSGANRFEFFEPFVFLFKFNVSENDEQRLNAQIPWLFPIMKSSLWGTNYLASTGLSNPNSAPKTFGHEDLTGFKYGRKSSWHIPWDFSKIKIPNPENTYPGVFAKLSQIKYRNHKKSLKNLESRN